ncbi:MAG: hypothetical protein KKF44_04515 [Nanoarchaeota archaeon]|nr:hypothetical protein [Nanoarchaeota archaeon]
MSLPKILGIMDAICALFFLFTHYFAVPDKALYIIAAYLFTKGLLFTVMSKDIASIIDLCAGLYALMITMGISIPVITTVVVVFLAQKAALSLVRLG